jgi:hypothetical protein
MYRNLYDHNFFVATGAGVASPAAGDVEKVSIPVSQQE